jgi:Ca2+-binding EF-hand superfamily protein
MKSLKLLTTSALIGLTAFGAHAADAAETTEPRPGMRYDPFPIVIADAEARAGQRFEALDADKDGKISRDEFAAGRMGGPLCMTGPDDEDAAAACPMGTGPHGMMGAGGMGGPGARGKMHHAFHTRMAEYDPEIFKRLDADGDGKLSSTEFGMQKVHDAARSVMHESMFARLDKNEDGALTRDEMPDPATRLDAMDANDDGTVTRDEARAYRRANRPAAN